MKQSVRRFSTAPLTPDSRLLIFVYYCTSRTGVL